MLEYYFLLNQSILLPFTLVDFSNQTIDDFHQSEGILAYIQSLLVAFRVEAKRISIYFFILIFEHDFKFEIEQLLYFIVLQTIFHCLQLKDLEFEDTHFLGICLHPDGLLSRVFPRENRFVHLPVLRQLFCIMFYCRFSVQPRLVSYL